MEIYPIVEFLLNIILSGIVSLLISNYSFKKQQGIVDTKKTQQCKNLVALELDDFMRIFAQRMWKSYPDQPVFEAPSAWHWHHSGVV